MKTAQLKTLVKNVILEWQASVAEEKVPGTVYLDDLGVKYSPDELRVMKMAVNTFSKGGHPMPDDKSIEFFGRNFVLQCLKKGEKLLTGKAKYAKDLALVKALIPKISGGVKQEDSSEFKDGLTTNMKAVNLENETPQAAERDLDDPKVVAHSIYQPVYLTRFVQDLPDGSKLYEILLHSANGPRHYIKQDKSKKWFYATRRDGAVTWNPADEYIADYEAFRKEKGLTEMSATGGVAGYSTPFAFTKNKKGSPRGIEAAKKYGKVVGEAPRV